MRYIVRVSIENPDNDTVFEHKFYAGSLDRQVLRLVVRHALDGFDVDELAMLSTPKPEPCAECGSIDTVRVSCDTEGTPCTTLCNLCGMYSGYEEARS
jgi:hypothetical protein